MQGCIDRVVERERAGMMGPTDETARRWDAFISRKALDTNGIGSLHTRGIAAALGAARALSSKSAGVSRWKRFTRKSAVTPTGAGAAAKRRGDRGGSGGPTAATAAAVASRS